MVAASSVVGGEAAFGAAVGAGRRRRRVTGSEAAASADVRDGVREGVVGGARFPWSLVALRASSDFNPSRAGLIFRVC